VGLYYNIVCIG